MLKPLLQCGEVLRNHLASNGVGRVFWSLDQPDASPGAKYLGAARLFLVLAGKADLILNDGAASARRGLCPGDALFMPAKAWFVPLYETEHQAVLARFFPEGILFSHYHHRPPAPFSGCVYHDLVQDPRPLDLVTHDLLTVLERVARSQPLSGAGPNLACALIGWMVERLAAVQPGQMERDRSQATYYLVRNYLEENYRNPLNRNEMAAVLRLHPDRISQLFAAHHPEGFTAYLNRLRLNEAERLLSQSRMSIGEIARHCGFSSTNYFVKAFRKRFALSPGRHRTALK